VSTTGRPTRAPSATMGSPRHALRRSVMMHPSLYLPLARLKRAESMLDGTTQLVLDGMERSANTFASIAFQLAQNGHVKMAHHMHAVAPLIEAAGREVPTLITARPAEATIVSAMIRQPRVTARQWLKTYVAFYERLLPFREAFAIATFDEVTSDFGAVIRRVNQRFTTSFAEFDHTEANVSAVFALIEERTEGPPFQPSLNRFVSGFMSLDEYLAVTRTYRGAPTSGTRGGVEHRIGRPSIAREAAKPAMQQRYHAASLAGLRERAERAYLSFVEPPVEPPVEPSVEPPVEPPGVIT